MFDRMLKIEKLWGLKILTERKFYSAFNLKQW